MKKFNWIITGTAVLYFTLMLLLYLFFQTREVKESMQYKVEVNEIITGLEKKGEFSKPDLHLKEFVQQVSFLPAEEMENQSRMKEFYKNRNGLNSYYQPLFIHGQQNPEENKLLGYVRFDYAVRYQKDKYLWISESILLFSLLFILVILFFLKMKIIKPFYKLSNMPYELSKGHLQGELEENKNRYFGRFIWGIGMLRDTLHTSKMKELKLEKDKKLLLLSLSHDIKIPLSTIRLYAKALKEEIYDTEEKKLHAAGQIEKHSLEIEEFVKQIINTSKEDILSIEVENTEFYISSYVDKIKKYYEPKCSLSMTELMIGKYENKLIKGDLDKSVEVMENLLENALKYGDGRKIVIEFYEEDYCQIVKVFNTGTTVAAEEIPHLFDSFYRGSNVENKEGNGLGLYINKQIMRKMGGDIFAQKAEDGMAFCLVFQV